MKTIKGKSVFLSLVLFAVLAVFLGSKVASSQVVSGGVVRAQGLQRPANTTDIYDKVITLEEKIAAMDERLVRIEKKIDALSSDMERVVRVLKKLNEQSDK